MSLRESGLVLAEVGMAPGANADVTTEDRSALFESMTPEEFPNIVEAIGVVEFDWDRQFAFGMNALMRGMDPLRAERPSR